MRILWAAILAVVTFGCLSAPAAGPSRPSSGAAPKATSKPTAVDDRRSGQSETAQAREAAALAFVRENHAELADLLEQLKAMKPDQYDRAIAELSQISRSLANLKRNDDRRHGLALEAWKAKSRAELLAAELVGAPTEELEAKLRSALESQLAIEVQQRREERELLESRLKKTNETIERLETKRDALIESRYQTLLKKGQRARRQEAGPSTSSRSAVTKEED